MNLRTVSKAIAGAVSGALAALATASADGGISSTEWVVIVLSALGAGALVFAAPANEPSEPA